IRDFHVTGVQTCALPISIGARNFGDDRKVSDLVLDRPQVFEVLGSLDPVANRFEEQSLGRSIAIERQPTEIEQRMIEIPAVDGRSEERRVGKGGRYRGGR